MKLTNDVIYWVLLALIGLLFTQNIILSKKLTTVWASVDNIEKILMEGTCD